MNAAAPLPIRPRRRSLGSTLLVVLLGGVCLGVAAPAPVEAQSASDLAQWEVRYQSALRAHEAAEAAMEEARVLFDQAQEARNLPLANERSQQRQTQERRLRQTQAALNQARDSLTAALDRRLEYLVEVEYEQASTDEGRVAVLTLAQDVEYQLRELDRTPPVDEARLAALAYPVTPSPRDSPSELESKARVLELRVIQADSLVVVIDARVELLQGRERLYQELNDFSANNDRFSANRMRVGAAESRVTTPREGVAADSTGLPGRTPAEEIAQLRELRETVILLRNADRQRAVEIRRLATGRSG